MNQSCIDFTSQTVLRQNPPFVACTTVVQNHKDNSFARAPAVSNTGHNFTFRPCGIAQKGSGLLVLSVEEARFAGISCWGIMCLTVVVLRASANSCQVFTLALATVSDVACLRRTATNTLRYPLAS